jgi:exoribonuclease II
MNPISRKSEYQIDKNDIQLHGMRIFLMDNGVATDNVIDTTIIHNTGSKLLDNVKFNNSHTKWNSSANKVTTSNKCLCYIAYINDNTT